MTDQQIGKSQTVTPTQLGVLLYDQGFRGAALIRMIAISIGCEDPSGNAGIVNNNPATGDYSVGLFQINYYGDLKGSRTKQFGSPTSLANNPVAQAKAAWQLSGGGSDFSPWAGDFPGSANTGCNALNAYPQATAIATKVSAMSKAQRAKVVDSYGTGAAGAAGGAASGVGSTAGSSSSSSSKDCLISFPSVLGIGGGCIFKSSWLDALEGGAILVAGGIILTIGMIMMIRGISKTADNIGHATTRSIQKVPGLSQVDLMAAYAAGARAAGPAGEIPKSAYKKNERVYDPQEGENF